MSPDPRSTELRRRAERLRQLAARIEAASVMQLDRFAGPDTWRGRRPDLCVTTLERNQQQLHQAADDARMQAYRLVCEADELDRLTDLLGGIAG